MVVAPGRRCPGGDGPHGLPRPGHRLHIQPSGLRHGVQLLRHRPGRFRSPLIGRRDRRTGGQGQARGPAPAPFQHRLHGHGRTFGQLRPDVGRRRAHPLQPRYFRPPHHRLDRGGRPGYPSVGRRGPARQPGRLAARGARRAPQPYRPAQPPLPPVGADGRLRGVPGGQEPAAVVRMGAHRRGQRHGPGRRRTGRACPSAAGPRQPHTAQPDPGLPRQGYACRRRHVVQGRAGGPGGQCHGPGQPGHRHRRRLRATGGGPAPGAYAPPAGPAATGAATVAH